MSDTSIDLSNTALAPPSIVGGSHDTLGDQKPPAKPSAPSKTEIAQLASEKYFQALHPRESGGVDISRPPELPKPLKPPQAEEVNPVSEWGNSMSAMIALFGSALTRTPMRTALNAAAAGINAQRQGDMAKYKQQLELWKDNSEYVEKLAAWQQNAYRQAVDFSKQVRVDTMLSQMYGVAVATGDDQMRLAVLSGDPKLPFDLMKSRDELSVRLQTQRVQMLKLGEEINRDHERAREFAATHEEAPPFKKNIPQVEGKDTVAYVNDVLNGVQETGKPVEDVIYQQESGNQPLPPHTITLRDGSTDEVAGKGQIRKATFDRIKLPTENWDNPKDVAAATDRLMANYKARGWDAGRIATAWISGPNNVTPMGQVNPRSTASNVATLSDEAASILASQWIATGKAPVGYARNAANMAKISNEFATQAKAAGMSGPEIATKQAEFAGLLQGERTLGANAARMEQYSNEVKYMAPLALQASEQVDRSRFPSLNSILIAGERGTGDENVVRFGLAANSLIYMYAKFLNPNGIPTDADKARATDILSTAWSKGQFRTAIDQIQQEINAGRAGVEAARKGITAAIEQKPAPAKEKTPAAPSGAPPVSLLKEGMETTFKNGQVWTLKNGVPQLVSAGGVKVQ